VKYTRNLKDNTSTAPFRPKDFFTLAGYMKMVDGPSKLTAEKQKAKQIAFHQSDKRHYLPISLHDLTQNRFEFIRMNDQQIAGFRLGKKTIHSLSRV